MAKPSVFTVFPHKKIRPFDGMSITAEVWDKAHTYHDQALRSHNLFFHGTGILTGLEVVASDPPDQLVYILPGVAVDSNGQVIVLSEPVAYDIGNDIEGPLYLLISYRQTTPRGAGSGEDVEPEYIEDQFLITARTVVPDQPVIELARFQRQNRTASLSDANEPLQPQPNEIDLRYRAQVQLPHPELISAAAVYLGKVREKVQGLGLAAITPEINRASQVRLVVDDDLQLGPNVLGYSLIYLVGEGSFQLTQAQTKGLQGYLKHGGALLLEPIDEPAKSAFLDLCAQMGVGLQRVSKGHPLLSRPHLFFAPPPGAAADGELLCGEGILLSTHQYGRFWSGEMGEQAPASRETIRASIEWGINLLSYILERRDLS